MSVDCTCWHVPLPFSQQIWSGLLWSSWTRVGHHHRPNQFLQKCIRTEIREKSAALSATFRVKTGLTSSFYGRPAPFSPGTGLQQLVEANSDFGSTSVSGSVAVLTLVSVSLLKDEATVWCGRLWTTKSWTSDCFFPVFTPRIRFSCVCTIWLCSEQQTEKHLIDAMLRETDVIFLFCCLWFNELKPC